MKKYKEEIITIIVLGGLTILLGFLIYDYIGSSAWKEDSLVKAIVGLIVYIVILNYSPDDKDNLYENAGYKALTLYSKVKVDAVILYFIFLFAVPALLIGLGTLLFIINNLYYIFAVYSIVTLLLFIATSKTRLINWLSAITLCLVLYFGFNARNDFRIEYRVIFHDKVIIAN